MNLSKNIAIDRIENAAVAGSSDVECDSVDMQGYDGVVFIALLGTLTANQVTALHAEGSADDSTFAALTGAATSAMADADSNKILVLDVYRPTQRYIKAVVDRATANAVLDGVIAIRYRGSKSPVTQGSTVSQIATVASPASA